MVDYDTCPLLREMDHEIVPYLRVSCSFMKVTGSQGSA